MESNGWKGVGIVLYDELRDLIADLNEMSDDEREETLRLELKGLSGWNRENSTHDASGYYAEYAWGEKCLALGHKQDPKCLDDDGFYDDYEDELFADDIHASGWDGDIICTETRHGVACMYCEGECELNYGKVPGGSIWERVADKRNDDFHGTT